MSRMIFVLYLGLLLLSCVAFSVACVPPESEPAENAPVDAETIYPLETEDGEVLLTVADIETDCNRFGRGAEFEATEDNPKIFLLYTVPYARYCATVFRRSGYITLRHAEGTVNRDENMFTWCVERPALQEPASLIVQPLTPTASFWLKLTRD